MKAVSQNQFQPTHWLFGILMTLLVYFEFTNVKPEGIVLGILGEIALGLAIVLSGFIAWKWRLILLVATLVPIAAPLYLGFDAGQLVVWTSVALGAGLLSVNFLRGAPEIPDRGLTAFLSFATVLAGSVFVRLNFKNDGPDIEWILALFGGPLAAGLFRLLTKGDHHETSH